MAYAISMRPSLNIIKVRAVLFLSLLMNPPKAFMCYALGISPSLEVHTQE